MFRISIITISTFVYVFLNFNSSYKIARVPVSFIISQLIQNVSLHEKTITSSNSFCTPNLISVSAGYNTTQYFVARFFLSSWFVRQNDIVLSGRYKTCTFNNMFICYLSILCRLHPQNFWRLFINCH